MQVAFTALGHLVAAHLGLVDFVALRCVARMTRACKHAMVWKEARIGEVSAHQLRSWAMGPHLPELHIGSRFHFDPDLFHRRFGALFESPAVISSQHWVVHVDREFTCHGSVVRSPLVTHVAACQVLPCSVLSFEDSNSDCGEACVPLPAKFCGDLVTTNVALRADSDVRHLRSWRHRVPHELCTGLFATDTEGDLLSGRQLRVRHRARNLVLELRGEFTPEWRYAVRHVRKCVVQKFTEPFAVDPWAERLRWRHVLNRMRRSANRSGRVSF
jgi:hypothetical protein